MCRIVLQSIEAFGRYRGHTYIAYSPSHPQTKIFRYPFVKGYRSLHLLIQSRNHDVHQRKRNNNICLKAPVSQNGGNIAAGFLFT